MVDGGYNIALAYCICVCVAIIPLVGVLAALGALIMFILTMVKAFEFKKLLA